MKKWDNDEIIIPDEGYDEAYPEEKVSQKEKAGYSPYRQGGKNRSAKKSH